ISHHAVARSAGIRVPSRSPSRASRERHAEELVQKRRHGKRHLGVIAVSQSERSSTIRLNVFIGSARRQVLHRHTPCCHPHLTPKTNIPVTSSSPRATNLIVARLFEEIAQS